MRRNQFVVDAESVQGNAGAEVTFRKITVGERTRYLSDPDYGDAEIVGDEGVFSRCRGAEHVETCIGDDSAIWQG